MAALGWYVNRLRSMSVPEVLHRVVEKQRKITAKRYTPDFSSLVPNTPLPYLSNTLKRAVLDFSDNPSIVLSLQKRTNAIERGEYHFLGVDWPIEPASAHTPPPWHLDPVSGNFWEQHAYCFAIPYRHAKNYGDVKYVWEINRLQYLHPVAVKAFLDDDPSLKTLCVTHVMDWIAHNPPYQGINWSSGIELALRAISLVFIVSLLRETFTQEQHQTVIKSLYEHGYWLKRYPSKFSSANNHLVAEAAALFIIGSVLPPSLLTQQWQCYGKKTLETEILKQIFDDGIGAEQSPTYTAFSLEFFSLALWVGQQQGLAFPPSYLDRLKKAGIALRCFVDMHGNLPRIGDDDEGRVLFTDFHEEDYVLSILEVLAGATNTPHIAPPRAVPSLRSFMFGVVEPFKAPESIAIFEKGGYTVIREKETAETETLLVFDHAPLGYLTIAAHGHADALSIWLHRNGIPVLVDAGTYLYHAGKEWRSHFRSTPAHNTLCINNTDSSTISGAFNWSHKARISLKTINTSKDVWTFTAQHDGYKKHFGLAHQRTLKRLGSKRFQLHDVLLGSKKSTPAEIGFLLHPDIIVTTEGTQCTLTLNEGNGAKQLLTIEYTGGLKAHVENGQQNPLRGWYSPAFGVRHPTTRLVFKGDISQNTPQEFTFTVF
jgi:uncharacterized heparinase superfamily protein